MNIKKIIREEVELFFEIKNNNIICYHRSNDYEHMINNEFSLDNLNNEYSIFGSAFYFASSPDISNQLGKYLCKFEISLDNPLNLNSKISNEQANKLLDEFIKKYELKIVDSYDFNEKFNGVQYGEFFLELQEIINDSNKYFKKFINHLGYNSFYHYSDYGTNFIETKGDYGYCYGIYNPKRIKFIDGPF